MVTGQHTDSEENLKVKPKLQNIFVFQMKEIPDTLFQNRLF